MLNGILNALWPSLCIACSVGVDKPGFCEVCQGTLVPAIDVSCTQCGDVFLNLPSSVPDFRCGPCLQGPISSTKVRAAFAYGGALRDAIVRWKNEPRPEVGKTMSSLMIDELGDSCLSQIPKSTEVIAMPTSFRRGFARGFNPAGQLARTIATHYGLVCRTDRLTMRFRLRRTQGLSRQERERRVLHGFKASPHVRGQTVLLVDDVRTTGRTLQAASKALGGAGAARVFAVVLASVPRDD